MRPALAAVLVCIPFAAGCAKGGFPEPCPPGEIPSIGKHDLAAKDDDADDETETKPDEGAKPEADDLAAAADDDDDDDETETKPDEGAEPEADEAPTAAPSDPPQDAPAADEPAEPLSPEQARLAAFEAARDDMERSADWLLCVLPETHPDQWVEHRDLVMDWIENHPTLGYTFSPSIMEPVHKDRRNRVSMYMNIGYAIGKARYLLSTDTPDPIEAEVAGLEAVAAYFSVFRAADPKLEARKLSRLLRKQKKGKLRPWIAKKLAGG